MPPRGRAPSSTTATTQTPGSQGDGWGRGQISDIQRARMLTAMAEVVSEVGLGDVTVAHVVARSGVSRRTFYEHFADREQCLLAALDAAIEQMAAEVVPAYERGGSWRERIRTGLTALLGFLEAQPCKGRLAIVQALGAGQAALERRQRVLARAIAAVDEGRCESRPGAEPPPLAGEGVVGAVLSVVHARLLEEPAPLLTALTSELMAMIVLPYLGPTGARRELAKPVPAARARGNAGLGSLRGLGVRLTYRTLRVLLAVGTHPGTSNRLVADAAGISDQGQVSKLLWRLEEIGLIRNATEHRVKGEPNAWTLTEQGESVRKAISAV